MDGLMRFEVRGWEVLRLSSDQVSVDIVPALGGTVVSMKRRADDLELLWSTPWGLRPQGAWSVPGNSEAQMFDTYPGGWQTLLPNGGDTSIVHGVELGYNGEARLSPFTWTETSDGLVLETRLVRSPFRVRKAYTVTGDEVTVSETIENVGGEPLEVIWGQQLVFGGPLVAAGTVVDATATTVHPDPGVTTGTDYDDVMPWPRSHGSSSVINLRTLPGPGANETRLAYVTDFSAAQASVRNADADIRVELTWESDSWPHLWYSMEAGARSGFPWFSRGYFLALTPCSSWPAHGIHDARRVAQSTLWVYPDEVRTSRLTVRVTGRSST